jgi:hypothetical protein
MTITYTATAQSAYIIDTFTRQYDTLVKYNSIVIENFKKNKYWKSFDKEFTLDFEFPFFDRTYRKVSFLSEGLGYVDDGGKYFSMYLLDNHWSTCDVPYSLKYVPYDYRYILEKENGKKVFKLEWHTICLYGEVDDIRPFNFQVWLWENGNIDFITGKLNKSDTSVYKEGVGFIADMYYPGDIGIVNMDDTYCIFYTGDYKKPLIKEGAPETILHFGRSILLTLPHEGFVIRFKRQTTSTKEERILLPIPNIVTDALVIPEDIIYSQYQICDLNGTILMEGTERNICVSHLFNGIYFIRFKDGSGVYTYKFLKQ